MGQSVPGPGGTPYIDFFKTPGDYTISVTETTLIIGGYAQDISPIPRYIIVALQGAGGGGGGNALAGSSYGISNGTGGGGGGFGCGILKLIPGDEYRFTIGRGGSGGASGAVGGTGGASVLKYRRKGTST